MNFFNICPICEHLVLYQRGMEFDDGFAPALAADTPDGWAHVECLQERCSTCFKWVQGEIFADAVVYKHCGRMWSPVINLNE